MLPVDLGSDPWFDNSRLQTLENINDLIRPKGFVATLILGILTLIAILTSFAASTTALVKEMQTATFVNEMHRNISVALSEQHLIDRKLEAKINALEEVILELGQDVDSIKTRLATRCHSSFHYICGTPLPYNKSENWSRTEAHLLGV